MTEEDITEAKIWKIAVGGIGRLVRSAPREWSSGSTERFYRAEKEVVMKHISPFLTGLMVSSVLFGTFRVSGSRWYARIRENSGRGTSPFGANPRPRPGLLEEQAEQKRQAAEDTLRLTTDVLISLLCGISSVAILLDTKKFQEDVVRAPLLPGKGLIHKHLCADFMNLYDNDRDFRSARSVRRDSSSTDLDDFVRNCRLRSNYIRQREETGHPHPDVVPYPGLRQRSGVRPLVDDQTK